MYFGTVVPDRGTGNWLTGYVRVDQELVIFLNIDVPGRTGHDFDNSYDKESGIVEWFGKPGSKSSQPTFKGLLNGELTPHFFARWDNTDPLFVYLGTARIMSIEDGHMARKSSGEIDTTVKLTLMIS